MPSLKSVGKTSVVVFSKIFPKKWLFLHYKKQTKEKLELYMQPQLELPGEEQSCHLNHLCFIILYSIKNEIHRVLYRSPKNIRSTASTVTVAAPFFQRRP